MRRALSFFVYTYFRVCVYLGVNLCKKGAQDLVCICIAVVFCTNKERMQMIVSGDSMRAPPARCEKRVGKYGIASGQWQKPKWIQMLVSIDQDGR